MVVAVAVVAVAITGVQVDPLMAETMVHIPAKMVIVWFRWEVRRAQVPTGVLKIPQAVAAA
jgi:hypothetical protein